MNFRPDLSDTDFAAWLEAAPSEDQLREVYLLLETKRAQLWSSGHDDSFRRDRYELDTRYVTRLVRVKGALARAWTETGQLAGLA